METMQLNLRISPVIYGILENNANLRGMKTTDYVRQILSREEKDITGAEIYRRSVRRARKNRAPLLFNK